MIGARKIFTLIVFFFALWFMGKAGYELWYYTSLNSQVASELVGWEVHKIGSSKYALIASYKYEVEGREYYGVTQLKKPYFLNQASAQIAQKNWQNQPFHAWYQAAYPEVSSLQKIFPLKDLAYAFLTLLVFFYFLFFKKIFVKDYRPLRM